VVHDRLAGRRGEQLGPKADEAARRDLDLEVGRLADRLHLLHLAAPAADQLDHLARVGRAHVDDQHLDRLVLLAVDLLGDHARLADRELEPLAAHRLEEDAEVEHAAAADLPGVGALGALDLHRDVAAQLPLEPLAQVARRDELAFPADERRVLT
jgi:hypothetical protein